MKILFAAKVKIHFVPLLEMEILSALWAKVKKEKCGRAEIGYTAHAAKVQIVRIIQMNSRSEYKKMLDRGVWGNALPSHTHTITSRLLRFLPSVANPSKNGTEPHFATFFALFLG